MGAVAKESREELAAVREYFTAIVQKRQSGRVERGNDFTRPGSV